MSSFAFEPVSLPVSRVQSNESSPQTASREPSKEALSPKTTEPIAGMPTPPLTPSNTYLRENQGSDVPGMKSGQTRSDPVQMTPQTSGPRSTPPTPAAATASSTATSVPDSSYDEGTTPPTSKSQDSTSGPDQKSLQTTDFAVGPSGSTNSLPDSKEPSHSRDESPSETSEREPERNSAVHAASYPTPRSQPPQGERDDPYARSKRPPQSRNLDAIENRFVFGKNDQRRRSGIGFGSTSGASSPVPRSSSATDLKNEHRQSTFSLSSLGGAKKDQFTASDEKHHHGSMSELKRFFFGGHHKSKRSSSPAPSMKSAANSSGSGTRTPPQPQVAPANVPFAEDHGLVTKYGKFGKILGSGAGGSVRLMKRSSDGVTFAVKQFRDRHTYESEKDYNKKVTAEFCIGSTLHHGNIIETLDIIHEGGKWYEVMEYAPFDLFAIVMTGKMSREEINCCFLQIVAGVSFLHGMGLAHRDLKLDNVVVNNEGIMKLIDFGSAVVFRYPFENDIILASGKSRHCRRFFQTYKSIGVVGSDPYLAPEVYDNSKYDPQPADVWSLGIIYACMALRRFPWKAPRMTDNSYKLFASAPSPGTPGAPEAPKETAENTDERRSSEPSQQGHHHHHHHHDGADGSQRGSVSETTTHPKQETIKGPWRLLRLLPRETRIIIGHMLDINPNTRAKLDEIMADPWVKGSPVCEQLEGGKVVHHGTHHHTLEPGSSNPPPK